MRNEFCCVDDREASSPQFRGDREVRDSKNLVLCRASATTEIKRSTTAPACADLAKKHRRRDQAVLKKVGRIISEHSGTQLA